MPNDTISEVTSENFEQVKFIREEVRFQHDLLNNRVSWYVASQSFLVTAFAISASSVKPFSEICILPYFAIPSLGILLSSFIIPAINAAIQRIGLQNGLLSCFNLKNYLPPRDDTQHIQSLRFASAVPVIFMMFWVLVLITGAWKVYRLFTDELRATGHTMQQMAPQALSTPQSANAVKGK
ncbi:MAG TPA: hypothetical protein VGB77_09885 [Abditibacteriaceae bacterium]|jgi:hypothetical protein